MKIYLDVCCLNRPFDDIQQERIRLEANAVIIILERCEKGELILISSDIIREEILRIPDIEKREAVLELQNIYKEWIPIDKNVIELAKQIEQSGVKPYDALHIASAEIGGADVFLTTDDKLLRKNLQLNLKTRILNPLNFIIKEMGYE